MGDHIRVLSVLILAFCLCGCYTWKKYAPEQRGLEFISGHETGYIPVDIRVIAQQDTLVFDAGTARIGEDSLGLFFQGNGLRKGTVQAKKMQIDFEDILEIRYGIEARFIDLQGRTYQFDEFEWAVRIVDGYPEAITGRTQVVDSKGKQAEFRSITIPYNELRRVELFEFDEERAMEIGDRVIRLLTGDD